MSNQAHFISLRFTKQPQTNFDNFQNAMLAVFQVGVG